MTKASIDYYWSFRSHYCYLSIGRVIAIQQRYPIEIRLRPVLPMAIRNPDFFTGIPKTGPNRWAYIQRDTERIAQRLGLPFGWPDPDPVIMNHETYQAANEQPHITRLNRLGVAADRLGCGLELAAAVSGVIFGGTGQWDEAGQLDQAIERAGIDLAALETDVSTHASQYDEQIIANGEALFAAGHWGVPTLVLEDEAFFGQDRLDDFCWALEQQGIKPV